MWLGGLALNLLNDCIVELFWNWFWWLFFLFRARWVMANECFTCWQFLWKWFGSILLYYDFFLFFLDLFEYFYRFRNWFNFRFWLFCGFNDWSLYFLRQRLRNWFDFLFLFADERGWCEFLRNWFQNRFSIFFAWRGVFANPTSTLSFLNGRWGRFDRRTTLSISLLTKRIHKLLRNRFCCFYRFFWLCRFCDRLLNEWTF